MSYVTRVARSPLGWDCNWRPPLRSTQQGACTSRRPPGAFTIIVVIMCGWPRRSTGDPRALRHSRTEQNSRGRGEGPLGVPEPSGSRQPAHFQGVSAFPWEQRPHRHAILTGPRALVPRMDPQTETPLTHCWEPICTSFLGLLGKITTNGGFKTTNCSSPSFGGQSPVWRVGRAGSFWRTGPGPPAWVLGAARNPPVHWLRLRLSHLCLCLHVASPSVRRCVCLRFSYRDLSLVLGRPPNPGCSHSEILTLTTHAKAFFPSKAIF